MKKKLHAILLVINILVALGLWVTGFGGNLNPERWGWLALLGYGFPVFLIATLAMMFVNAVLRKRQLMVSFIALLVAYTPVSLYYPINRAETVEDGEEEVTEGQTEGRSMHQQTLKLMSYNTCDWGGGTTAPEFPGTKEEKRAAVMEYLKGEASDILALQECPDFADELSETYAHHDSVCSVGGTVFLYSKFPIIKKENVLIPTKGNVAGAFWLDINGRKIIAIVTHLETMGLSISDREKFSNMVHGNEDRQETKSTSRSVFSKILAASKKRASQARSIRTFIEAHQGTPMVIMGDFNDIPQSYTHHTIASCDNITDCYQAKGFGTGYSYRRYAMHVRIDNIMCSTDAFTPLSCEVDNNIPYSDHFPIKAFLVQNL